MKSKHTPQDIKQSYERLKVGKVGLPLKLLNEITLALYHATQDAKLN